MSTTVPSQTVRAEDTAVPPVTEGIVARPALLRQLAGAARVTQISAPAGSGKTCLLRSWVAESGRADSVAWVPVRGGEQDPQRFWISVLDALRTTTTGSEQVRPVTGVPDLDCWTAIDHLLEDLGTLDHPIWLVIDDLHELRSVEALAQLELFLMRAPPELRLVLVARSDLRLGLHRLRLQGELAEIRAGDLRFSVAEARALFDAAGVDIHRCDLAALVTRTEGWAAGLRLAALSAARHPQPERFAEEFSGSERTVADYLLAEVLDHQPERVRHLLLRTSICERVSGELADTLTTGSGGEQILQDLEQAGAFVIAVDARRSWFRYHTLFADLLRLELRRTEPAELSALLCAAARWFVERGYPVDAIRHAQAALDCSQVDPGDDMRALAQGEVEPTSLPVLHQARGMLDLARGNDTEALAAFRLAEHSPVGRGTLGRIVAPGAFPEPAEPITDGETRVLRYLPTNLRAHEIAAELCLSVNTVRTHMRHLYAKLDAHRRTEAVDRARVLGLFATSAHRH